MTTLEALQKLHGYRGAEVYLVGGFVRDYIRRKKNKDLDIVVKGLTPHEIKTFLGRYGTSKYANLTFDVPIIIFRAFGDKFEAQITLPRDGQGRFRPNNSLKEDGQHRDFSINAMYLPINYKSKNDLIDFFGGYKDIRKRLIKAVGNPNKRIAESPIRMLRAISLAARTNYRISKSVMKAIGDNSKSIGLAPVEGIREELNEIILSRKPSRYFQIMQRTGLLAIVLPELNNCVRVRQDNRYHKFDVFRHCIYTCDNIEPNLVLRWAAVLHDIGKPDTREKKKGKTTFHKHEVVSAKLTKIVLERLRFRKDDVRDITHLVRMHMYHYTREFSDAAVRRFIKKAGITEKDLDSLGDLPLFKLRKAERKGNGFKTIPVTERQHDFEKRIVEVFRGSTGFEIKDLAVNGETLMRIFNLKQSKTVGDILKHLLDKVLENPKVNTEKELIKIAAEYLYYER